MVHRDRALAESEELYRAAFQTSPDSININRMDGVYVDINEGFTKLTGYTRDEVIGVSSRDLAIWTIPEDRAKLIAGLERGGAVDDLESVFRCRDGTLKAGMMSARVVHINGEPHILSVTRDVTERKRAEQALRESEEKYRQLVEQAVDGILLGSHEGIITGANSRMLDIAGRTPQEILGRHIRVLFSDEELRKTPFRFDLLQQGEQVVNERCLLRPDDSEVSVEMHSKMMPDGTYQSIIRDVSERKRAEQVRIELERRLLHAQKLESLGVLAGGIAHDFNNLLMAILGNLEMAGNQVPPASSARSSLDRATLAARRAADLTRQMLAYSGKGHFVVEPLDVSELLEENAHMLRAAISKSVTLQLELAAGLPRVRADASQLQQVAMNLITNASEAHGEGAGVISLKTGVQDCDAACLSRSRVDVKPEPGRFVFLEVSDTGCGMDEATMQQLFDPFFTTKFAGRGLGMSALLGIVKGHGGAVWVDSEVGRGSAIRVLLPASESDPTERAKAADVGPESGARLTGTVLVADDEPLVLGLCREMLGMLGLQALCVTDGAEAVSVYRDRADEIGAVLLDLTMPRMDGISCFKELRAVRPDVKVLLSTGFSETEVAERIAGKGFGGVIQKPYTLARLREELTRLLGGV